jgi:hypothetical protein
LIAGGKIKEKKTTKESELAKLTDSKSKNNIRERIVAKAEK